MKKPPGIFNYAILAQLSVTIVVTMVVPLLAGIWLSRTLNLGPLAIVLMMTIGITVGALAVYRIVKNAYEQLGGGK